MTETTDPTALSDFLRRIEPLTDADLRDAFANEAIETGGLWINPANLDPNFRAFFAIFLHDIYIMTHNLDRTIAIWTKEARTAAAPTPAIRATDGRPDCPYNGQGMA